MRVKTKQEKVKLTLKVLFLLISIGYVIVLFISHKLFGEDSLLAQVFYPNSNLENYNIQVIAILRSLGLIILTYICSKVIRQILAKCLLSGKNGITALKLIDSAIKYLAAIIMIILVLNTWGVETATILASAGILSLVIGLGAQSLIADIIAGVFIVFEGDFRVNDIVVIDGWRGTIKEIGIRTTKIEDAGGNVKIINNSEIKTIINQTKELSVAKCTMSIAYEESLPRVELVIRDHLAEIKNNLPDIIDGPYYKGVSELAASSVNLLFVAKCKEENLYQVQRDLTKELFLLFSKENINIPFNQLVVSQKEIFEQKTTKKMADEAHNFASEQKELSKHIQEEESK